MSNTLHIVSRLENGHLPTALQRCFNEGDALLLTCDAVYAAFHTQATLPANCYALQADIQARGLLAQWPAAITPTDHHGFVALCTQYAKSLSWAS